MKQLRFYVNREEDVILSEKILAYYNNHPLWSTR